jgi:serine/threonine protein kinase
VTAQPLPRGYDYVRVLGSGAFGEVVLARQLSLDRLVAIKRIHQFALTDPDAIVRFRREAQVLAAVEDPTIVRVYDFMTGLSGALLIMEFVEGAPFDELIAGHALPVERVLQVLGDVARALTVAARAGVTHRDVKPGNVFVLKDGHAKLGDFGLARVLTDPGVFRTTHGAAAGTPAYFPPEVSQGAEPDARSDAYSFAVMAYEALAGRRPIHGEDPMSVVAAHWFQDVQRPEAFVPGFPSTASDALLQGLAKQPELRLTPAELMDRLRSFPATAWPATLPAAPSTGPGGSQSHEGTTRLIPVAAPANISALPRPRRRRRRAAILIGAGVAIVATAAGLALSRSGSSAPDLAVVSAVITVTPADGRARCPNAEFDFVARITTNGERGTLVSTWTLPGGRRPGAQHVDVSQGQREVSVGAHFRVTGQRPLDGRAELRIGAMTVRSPEIHYEC